ncbi:NAD kinase-like isoform X2 [Babylonia areolata]|uniref:NAD kinase-like isoform X2 n=1 Tax=Babylonia areolata TaxID=304850 RepID=UPI003FD08173
MKLLRRGSDFGKIPDPSSQKLNWLKTPLSVLVIKKPYDVTVTLAFRDLVIWLVQEKSLLVFAEESVVKDEVLSDDQDFQMVQDKLKKFREGVDDLEDKVDFIICLGGDGTLLYASSLFQQSVPPVIAFNMGSLGFLTPFPICNFKERIDQVLKGQAPLLLRYRLKCVMVNHIPKDDPSTPIPHVKNIDKNSRNISTHVLVLNEVVIDRGPSSYLCNLDLYIEGHLVTSVLGDGLIISTPTGSTAYSVAAGASMIHPNVPCILITPICPHSLSFRPIVVPAGVEIKVTLAPEARGCAMVSFDGRNRQEMSQGCSLRITTASYPVPSICAHDQIEDWFNGLADCLHWNVRKPQKALSTSASLNSLDSVDFEANK